MLITRCEARMGFYRSPGAAEKKPWKRVCMHLMVPGRLNYRVMNDAKALQMSGYEVIICDVISDRNCPREEVIEDISFQHVLAPNWFVPVRWKFWFLVKMFILIVRCAFRLFRCDADIYHAHVEHAFPAAYAAARFRRKGLIFDTPELTMFGPTILRWPVLRWWAIRVIRWMSISCDCHITGSPLYKPILQDLYGNEHILILRHIPPYRKAVRNTCLQQKLGLDPNVRIALYQGYVKEDRGLDTLLLAAQYLNPGTVIVLMGASYGNTEAQLRRLIQQERLEDRVKILPAVPYDELLMWTSSADIGLIVLPPDYSLSIRFCLPNKFFEYIMAGLPILSSNLDAISDVIHLYKVGHVLSDLTPSAIGQAINTMLANQEELTCIRANALNAVRSGLTWEDESRHLVHLYQDIYVHRLKERQDKENII
jgi:glycosyltransferase involved in cell wall biosynthesis